MADAIAVYGAIVGSAAGVGHLWNIYHSVIRDRPRVKVRLERGGDLVVPPDSMTTLRSPRPGDWPGLESRSDWLHPGLKIYLGAENQGQRPITLVAAGLGFERDDRAAFTPTFSYRLDPGGYFTASATHEHLADVVRRHRTIPRYLWFQDIAGKLHRSKVAKDVRPWLKTLLEE